MEHQNISTGKTSTWKSFGDEGGSEAAPENTAKRAREAPQRPKSAPKAPVARGAPAAPLKAVALPIKDQQREWAGMKISKKSDP